MATGTNVASLYATLAVDASQFQTGIQSAETALTGLANKTKSVDLGPLPQSYQDLMAKVNQSIGQVNLSPLERAMASARLQMESVSSKPLSALTPEDLDSYQKAASQLAHMERGLSMLTGTSKAAGAATGATTAQLAAQTTQVNASAAAWGQYGQAVANQIPGLGGISGALGKAAMPLMLGGLTVGAVSAAWSLGELAMRAERSEKYFNAFSGSSQQAAVNLQAMRNATGGALSTQEAMGAATQYLSMGIAKNSTDLEKLARMAVLLGGNTRSAGDAMNEFALLLANQSIERLDTFGISSGRVRERIKEMMAADAGLSREQAFVNAVLEDGSRKMAQLEAAGVRAGTASDKLRSSWADLKVALGKLVVPVVEPVMTGTAKVVGGVAEQAEKGDRATETQASMNTMEIAIQEKALAEGRSLLAFAEKYHIGILADVANRQIAAAQAALGQAQQTQFLSEAMNTAANDAMFFGASFQAAIKSKPYDYFKSPMQIGGQALMTSEGWTDPHDAQKKAAEAKVKLDKEAAEKSKQLAEQNAHKAEQDWNNAVSKMASGFQSAVQSVPGLFGASQVTDTDVQLAKAGLYQPKVDEKRRQLQDWVLNPEAAKRANYGIDPQDLFNRAGVGTLWGGNMEARKAGFAEFSRQWDTGELFAGGKNADLINKEAINRELARMKAGQAGKEFLTTLVPGWDTFPQAVKDQIMGQSNAFLAGKSVEDLAGGKTGGATAQGAGGATGPGTEQPLTGGAGGIGSLTINVTVAAGAVTVTGGTDPTGLGDRAGALIAQALQALTSAEAKRPNYAQPGLPGNSGSKTGGGR